MNDEMPLRCKAHDGAIDMGIGINVLKFAAEQHPAFWDGESGPEIPNIVIIDTALFAREVVREINREREDGSTLLTDLLDAAVERAVENGCEGVDHDASVSGVLRRASEVNTSKSNDGSSGTEALELPLIIPENYDPHQAVRDAIDMVDYALTHASQFTSSGRARLSLALFHMQRVMR